MSFNVCCLILINKSECSALTAFPLSVLGKVTFKKVMHYNIALLPKKVTNYVTYSLFMESNALHYFCVTF